jgi:hypothetical protein
MSQANPLRAGHFFTRWLGRPRSRSSLPWVIDHREDGRWIEYGRHVSKSEATSVVTRLVAEGRGETASFRVVKRPIADPN